MEDEIDLTANEIIRISIPDSLKNKCSADVQEYKDIIILNLKSLVYKAELKGYKEGLGYASKYAGGIKA